MSMTSKPYSTSRRGKIVDCMLMWNMGIGLFDGFEARF
jgi:hypothetical protein